MVEVNTDSVVRIMGESMAEVSTVSVVMINAEIRGLTHAVPKLCKSARHVIVNNTPWVNVSCVNHVGFDMLSQTADTEVRVDVVRLRG